MSTDNAEQPVKRKSVADMWREREQAMLDKQQQPYTASSPARRSFKRFEEKKIEEIDIVNTGDSANVENTSSSIREAEGASKTASTNATEASTSRRPVSTKSKFAMMGQKHASRPKKLPSYQQYQQVAKKNDPKSPDSANSDALLGEAFDDAVAAQEGKRFSGGRRAAQSDGVETRPSEYSSLQVSDSASIPKDVHRKYSNDNHDDASNISGLSSPGSPARSSRNQRRSKAIEEGLEHDEGSFDSEGHSALSTVSPVPEYPTNYPQNLDDLSVAVSETVSEGLDAVSDGINAATEAVVKEGFVEESGNEVSAFQDAIQKMSLGDIAKDMKEEATAVFGGVIDINKMQNDLNESMVSASQRFNSLFAKKEEDPAQAEKSAEGVEVSAEGEEGTTPAENSETPENEEPVTENAEVVAATTEPKSEEPVSEEPVSKEPVSEEPAEEIPASEDPVAETAENAEPVTTETPEIASGEAAPTEGKDDGSDAPDPPLETTDSSDPFDPFATSDPGDFANFADFAAFPDDTFSSNFAAPAPAPKPVEPEVPTKELSSQGNPVKSPPRRRPPPAEEMAIEVEYLEDSDDDQADV